MNCLLRTPGRPGFQEGALEIDETRGLFCIRSDTETRHLSCGRSLIAYVSNLAFVTPRGKAVFMEDQADFEAVYDHLLSIGWVRRATHAKLRNIP